jgi:membrane protein involved in colicin uptake
MARGWESKSVEEQMATALEPPMPASTEEKKRMAVMQRADQERQKQALNLQRENILSQRTSSPARRSALEAALAQIEAQINALG